MTGISHQWQLMALAWALYLSDCTVLLFANQGALIAARGGHWRALFGGGVIITGRALHLLNPLTPHRAAFRLTWNQEDELVCKQQHSWSELQAPLGDLAPFVMVAGMGLFLLLPLGMFTELGTAVVIAALVSLYGGLVIALFKLHQHKQRTPLRGRSFAAFAFECLACPPFGINMIRRLTLRTPVPEALPLAARRLLPAEHWLRIRDQFSSALQAAADSNVDDPVRRQLLLQRQRELAAI